MFPDARRKQSFARKASPRDQQSRARAMLSTMAPRMPSRPSPESFTPLHGIVIRSGKLGALRLAPHALTASFFARLQRVPRSWVKQRRLKLQTSGHVTRRQPALHSLEPCGRRETDRTKDSPRYQSSACDRRLVQAASAAINASPVAPPLRHSLRAPRPRPGNPRP